MKLVQFIRSQQGSEYREACWINPEYIVAIKPSVIKEKPEDCRCLLIVAHYDKGGGTRWIDDIIGTPDSVVALVYGTMDSDEPRLMGDPAWRR